MPKVEVRLGAAQIQRINEICMVIETATGNIGITRTIREMLIPGPGGTAARARCSRPAPCLRKPIPLGPSSLSRKVGKAADTLSTMLKVRQ